MYYIDIHILSQILNDWARPKTQSHHQDQYFQTGLGWHLPTAMKIHTPGKNWTETVNDHIISTWNSECFVVHQTTESRFIKSLHSLHHLHHWPKGFICSHGLIHQKLWRWKEKIEVSNTVLWCQHVNNISKSSDQKHLNLNLEHQNIIRNMVWRVPSQRWQSDKPFRRRRFATHQFMEIDSEVVQEKLTIPKISKHVKNSGNMEWLALIWTSISNPRDRDTSQFLSS